MKKNIITIFMVFVMASCYDEYVNDYNFDAVYFTYQVDVRTFVVGEGMKIDCGVILGGVLENERDRVINYKKDTSLLSPAFALMKNSSYKYIKNAVATVTDLKLLPGSYYTMSDSARFIIRKGHNLGKVTIKPDSALFLSDPETLKPTYAIPLTLTTADADSVLTAKKTTVIGIRYENMLFGNYWHGGVTTVKDPGGNVIQTINYYTVIPSPESKVWTLTTIAPNALTVKGFSDLASSKNEIVFTIDGSAITVSSAPGSTFTFEPEGESTFNRAKLLQNRKIVLSYKYINGSGNTCYAQDTLTFRNRIRDGVNEWMDENPSNYN